MSHEADAITDFDRDRGTIILVVQAVGKTTRQMQQLCQAGSTLYGVVGPMGVPIGAVISRTSTLYKVPPTKGHGYYVSGC